MKIGKRILLGLVAVCALFLGIIGSGAKLKLSVDQSDCV